MQQGLDFKTAGTLAQRFKAVVRERHPAELAEWIAAGQSSGLRELASFTEGWHRKAPHVPAALEVLYSTGIAERNITRLKQIRRAIYGRGNFDLLKIRMRVPA